MPARHRRSLGVRAIVERYQRAVYAVSFSSVRDRALSDDITQDTFVSRLRGGHVRDARRARSASPGAGVQPPGGKLAIVAKKVGSAGPPLAKLTDQMREQEFAECERIPWSIAVRRCIVTSTTHQEMGACP